MTLAELQPGQSGVIENIFAKGMLAQRLIDMGLYPGVLVSVIRNAPLGDPVEVEADGTYVSLRRAEAQYVTIRTES